MQPLVQQRSYTFQSPAGAALTVRSLNQRRRHICRSALRRGGATAYAARGCPSAWIVVLVSILQRRPTVTLCHDTSLRLHLSLSPGWSRGLDGDLAGRPHELVAIRRIGRDSGANWLTGLVVARHDEFVDRYAPVIREVEEGDLGGIRHANDDSLTPADLLDADGVLDVADGALGDVLGLDEPDGTPLHEAHGIVRRLQRVRQPVDEALLLPADHGGVVRQPQFGSRQARRPLYLDPRHRDIGPAQAALHFRCVTRSRVVTDMMRRHLGGQAGHERIDLLRDEGALA